MQPADWSASPHAILVSFPAVSRADRQVMVSTRTFLATPVSGITPEMEESFFTSIMGRNGTYKTTYTSRFSEIDDCLLNLVENGSINVSSVLDIGISSGINTLEFYELMSAVDRDIRVVGTDILIDAELVRVLPGCYVLVDQSGFPLRFDVFGSSVKPWVSDIDYRTGFALVRKCINYLFRKRASHVRAAGKRHAVEQVKLVSPRLLRDNHICVLENDITEFNSEFASRFTFVRAANILNKGYFSDDALLDILQNIRRYMIPASSSLLVVRTHEDRANHGTLFRLADNNRFVLLQRFGAGSEIESLVLNS